MTREWGTGTRKKGGWERRNAQGVGGGRYQPIDSHTSASQDYTDDGNVVPSTGSNEWRGSRPLEVMKKPKIPKQTSNKTSQKRQVTSYQNEQEQCFSSLFLRMLSIPILCLLLRTDTDFLLHHSDTLTSAILVICLRGDEAMTNKTTQQTRKQIANVKNRDVDFWWL